MAFCKPDSFRMFEKNRSYLPFATVFLLQTCAQQKCNASTSLLAHSQSRANGIERVTVRFPYGFCC